jgi:hypothetical protein
MHNILTMNRRTFLRGAGAMIALPFLESIQTSRRAENHPTRVCFLYVPNGMYMPDWKPRRVGTLLPAHLPATLKPLTDLRSYVTVVSGLDNKVSEKTGRPEGFGQHARSIGAYLSAVYPDRSLRAGTTIDVILSQRLSARARVPLLNLGTEYAEDEKDVGYSEVFNYSLSWKDAGTPIQPIISPRMVFERLCGDSKGPGVNDEDIERLRKQRGSVLDAVLESSSQLLRQVSRNDGQVITEYLDNLREIEQELSGQRFADATETCAASREMATEPESFEDRLRIMFDLLHMALRANLTNVATLMLGAERSERDFGFLTSRVGFNMSGGHHSISHHSQVYPDQYLSLGATGALPEQVARHRRRRRQSAGPHACRLRSIHGGRQQP